MASEKNIHYCNQNYPATLVVGRVAFQIKPGNIKFVNINNFLTHHYTTMLRFSPKLIFIFNSLRNYSKRPHLQNKDNMTSKDIRSQQIEIMGKEVSSSLLL